MDPIIIQKNAREVYRLAWETWQGRTFLDFRIYFHSGDGELKPSRKGLAVRRDSIPALVAGLTAAMEGGE